jgi:hypothetical protein
VDFGASAGLEAVKRKASVPYEFPNILDDECRLLEVNVVAGARRDDMSGVMRERDEIALKRGVLRFQRVGRAPGRAGDDHERHVPERRAIPHPLGVHALQLLRRPVHLRRPR